MQEQCFEVSRTTNADVQRKLKNKYDTRAAAAVENITKQGTHQHTRTTTHAHDRTYVHMCTHRPIQSHIHRH